MKAYWGVEVQLLAFLTSILDVKVSDQLHAPSALPPEKIHCTGNWVSPRAALDAVVRKKIPSPYCESNPQPSRL
jgi:hypothetical protein